MSDLDPVGVKDFCPIILGLVSSLPNFTRTGDLPPGVHQATLAEVSERFGPTSIPRRLVAQRLERIHELARLTGKAARFIVFGSFVTDTPEPNDVDVFLLIDESFDVGALEGEAAILFNDTLAQAYLGASIFWLRRLVTSEEAESLIGQWQIKRDGTLRGIVEVVDAYE